MTNTPTPAARVIGTIKALDRIRIEASGREAVPLAGTTKRELEAIALALSGRLGCIERIARAAIQSDPEPQPVAWQWRYRADTTNGNWSEWLDGKASNLRGPAYETEERPLFATPSSAGTVMQKAS